MSSPKRKMKPDYVCDISSAARENAAEKARFRANLPHQPTYKPRMQHYRQHLQNLQNVQGGTNTTGPLVPKELYDKTDDYNTRGQLFQRIVQENSKLLHKIATIYAGEGTIDNNYEWNCHNNRTGLERERKCVELVFQNYHLYQRFKKVKATYSRIKDAEWYAEQEKNMDKISLYPLHFKKCPCSEKDMKIIQESMKKPKQYAYLQVEMQDTTVCNLVFELNAKMCPFTCENFKLLCCSATDCNNMSLSYRFHNIEKLASIQNEQKRAMKTFWQIGSGVNVLPQFAKYTAKENSKVKHTEAWLLTRPISVNSGLFYITIGSAPYLDESCNVFGKLVGAGVNFLKKMREVNVTRLGVPRRTLLITDCGVTANENSVPKPVMMQDFVQRAHQDMAPVKVEKEDEEYYDEDLDEEYDDDE